MASLNDYYAGKVKEAPSAERRSSFSVRMTAQLLAAVAVFLLVLFICRSAGEMGYYARVLVNNALSMENSWLFGEDALPVSSETLYFKMPVEGVAVKAYAEDGNGVLRIEGLSILPCAGKQIRPSADGVVAAVRGTEGNYSMQINHAGGIATIYKGLDAVIVTEGSAVSAKDPIGISGRENILFGIYIDGVPVDPLSLLQDIK